MTPDGRARVIRERIRSDMVKTLRGHIGANAYVPGPLLDALADDAMHHVEHLLAEIDEAKEKQ